MALPFAWWSLGTVRSQGVLEGVSLDTESQVPLSEVRAPQPNHKSSTSQQTLSPKPSPVPSKTTTACRMKLLPSYATVFIMTQFFRRECVVFFPCAPRELAEEWGSTCERRDNHLG